MAHGLTPGPPNATFHATAHDPFRDAIHGASRDAFRDAIHGPPPGTSHLPASALAALRESVGRLEAGISPAGSAGAGAERHPGRRVPLGHAAADGALGGGLALGALHEVHAVDGGQAASVIGFAAGLARRAAARRPILWARQDFAALEAGEVSASGLAEFGIDPRRLVLVRAADGEAALRVAADALACGALGAVVLELWGPVRAFDPVASRKLTLAARETGVTAIVSRLAGPPSAASAETRWSLRAGRSPAPASSMRGHARPGAALFHAWGAPLFDAHLVRNRHGPSGQWIMEWNNDESFFQQPAFQQPASCASARSAREPAPHSLPAASAPADRPAPAAAAGLGRRAG